MSPLFFPCFLLGTDPVTGKNFDHRKEWIEQQLHRLAACFGIDLLGFSILSNHFHLILRSRPDVVSAWDDREVARRWLMICPLRKDSDGIAAEPSPMELNTIMNDPQKLQMIGTRSRVSQQRYDIPSQTRELFQDADSRPTASV
jgi:hypothetical protein